MTQFLRKTSFFFLNNSSSLIPVYFPTPELAFFTQIKEEILAGAPVGSGSTRSSQVCPVWSVDNLSRTGSKKHILLSFLVLTSRKVFQMWRKHGSVFHSAKLSASHNKQASRNRPHIFGTTADCSVCHIQCLVLSRHSIIWVLCNQFSSWRLEGSRVHHLQNEGKVFDELILAITTAT